MTRFIKYTVLSIIALTIMIMNEMFNSRLKDLLIGLLGETGIRVCETQFYMVMFISLVVFTSSVVSLADMLLWNKNSERGNKNEKINS